MKNFQKIGLILSNEASPEVVDVVERTKAILDKNNSTYVEVDNKKYRQEWSYPAPILAKLAKCDLIIAFGGDGTFLGIARKINHLNIPVLGVNLGRLGFLTDLDEQAIQENLESILRGEYTREKRFLLHADIEGRAQSLAMNDVVIHKSELSRMIELDVYVDDQYLSSYRADGLIFSTPTGSTAYSLSTGGPIIYPTLPAILIAPICPHTFSHRPLVIPSNSKIKVVISEEGTDEHVNVTCDGQELFTLSKEGELNIACAGNPITLIHPLDYSFFTILREKLNWGHQPNSRR